MSLRLDKAIHGLWYDAQYEPLLWYIEVLGPNEESHRSNIVRGRERAIRIDSESYMPTDGGRWYNNAQYTISESGFAPRGAP